MTPGIRKPGPGTPPVVGDWILPASLLRDGIVMAPRRVVKATAYTVMVIDPREGEGHRHPKRLSLSNVAYVATSERVAQRAYEVSERLRRNTHDARVAARADIEAIADHEVAP